MCAMPSEYSSQVGQHLQLGGVQAAERNLDALHARRIPQRVRTLGVRRTDNCSVRVVCAVGPLAVVIPLAVGAAPQPRLGENPVFDLALLLERDLVFEDVDLGAPDDSGIWSPSRAFHSELLVFIDTYSAAV